MEVAAPLKPKIQDERDTANIDKAYLHERPIDSPVVNNLTSSQQAKVYFDNFSYKVEDEFKLVSSEQLTETPTKVK